jgi:hypothetical protein
MRFILVTRFHDAAPVDVAVAHIVTVSNEPSTSTFESDSTKVTFSNGGSIYVRETVDVLRERLALADAITIEDVRKAERA